MTEDAEPYVCPCGPCGACIAGLRLQIARLPEGEDDPWLRNSLGESRAKRHGDSRFRNKDERGVTIRIPKS